MRRQGITVTALQYMLENGRVEHGCCGGKTVYFDPGGEGRQIAAADENLLNPLCYVGAYAVLDRNGEIITIGRQPRRGCQRKPGKL